MPHPSEAWQVIAGAKVNPVLSPLSHDVLLGT
jgi:hypothetical protein